MKIIVVEVELFAQFQTQYIPGLYQPIFTRTDRFGEWLSSSVLADLMQGHYVVNDKRARSSCINFCIETHIVNTIYNDPEYLIFHAVGELVDTSALYFSILKESGWQFDQKAAEKYKLPKPSPKMTTFDRLILNTDYPSSSTPVIREHAELFRSQLR